MFFSLLPNTNKYYRKIKMRKNLTLLLLALRSYREMACTMEWENAENED